MDLWLSPHDARVRDPGVLLYGFAESPFGTCAALAAGPRIAAISFTESRIEALEEFQNLRQGASLENSPATGELLSKALAEPMSVPVMAVGTPFQLLVWEFLRTRAASPMTYGEVAAAIGRPGAARAVGRAVAGNRIAMLIPCHRVVPRSGKSGYRWGEKRKEALLAWELTHRDPLKMPF